MAPFKFPKRLHLAFTLIELMVVVTIIGILAAVAVPAFKKYLIKSKTTEASLNMQKIYGGQVTYYTEEHLASGGAVLPKQFVTAAATPALASIGVDKIVGDFSTAGWEAARFATDSAVNYSYSVVETGTDLAAQMTVRAQGDLDGDTIYSLFERVATIAPGGDVQGGSGIYSIDELE